MESTNAPTGYAFFIGRYQTLHEGHKCIFRKKIEEGIPVMVAIRKVAVDEKNPYSVSEVMKMFQSDEEVSGWIRDGKMALMSIPDIEGVYYGRGVGYKVEQIEVPAHVAAISATELREQKKKEGLL